MIGVYARVSTEEQAKHGYSLADQVRQCRIKAGMDEVKEYIDNGYSGEFLQRPGLDELRIDVREGLIDKVIVFDPDRWSRNLMNQLLVTDEIEKRALIVFVNGEYEKTPEGRLFYQMRGAISEFEKAKIKERTRNGRKEKARQGRILRDFQVYGYSFDPAAQKFIEHPEESKIVKLIFDLFTSPNDVADGSNGIAHYLTEIGVPTKREKGVWHRQVVRQILMNRAFIGEFYQNKWDTEGMHGNKHRAPEDKIPMTLRPEEEWIKIDCPALISEYQFEQAQKILAESRRRFTKNSVNDYLLSGLVRCGECENTMTGRKTKSWGKHVFEYTDRKSTAGAKFKGCGRIIRRDLLDEQVWEKVLNFLSEDDDHQDNDGEEGVARKTVEEIELERLQQEIERVQQGRKRLVKLFSGGELDAAGEGEVKSQLKDMADKEAQMNKRLSDVKQTLERSMQLQYSQATRADARHFYLEKNRDQLTFEDKKQLIRMVVREIRVYKDRVDVHGF